MQYEIIRYLISGVCTTLVNIGVFTGLRYAAGLEMQVANCISIVSAILFAFVVNKKFVFESRSIHWKILGREAAAFFWKEFLSFSGMRVLSLAVEVFGMQFLTACLHLQDMAAKIFLQIVVIGMNYVISKFYVFKRRED